MCQLYVLYNTAAHFVFKHSKLVFSGLFSLSGTTARGTRCCWTHTPESTPGTPGSYSFSWNELKIRSMLDTPRSMRVTTGSKTYTYSTPGSVAGTPESMPNTPWNLSDTLGSMPGTQKACQLRQEICQIHQETWKLQQEISQVPYELCEEHHEISEVGVWQKDSEAYPPKNDLYLRQVDHESWVL